MPSHHTARSASAAPAARGWTAALLSLILATVLTGCTVPGQLQPDPTAPATVAATVATTAAATPATATSPASRSTATALGSPPPLATNTPGARGANAATRATIPTPATSPTPVRTPPSTSPGRATPSPGRGTPAAAATPRPPFAATPEEPCRASELEEKPLPERKTTLANIEQAYRCFLLNYVDAKTMDHRVLLNGSWSYLAQAGEGVLAPEDTAPLALVNDRDADWQVFAERYTALGKKYARIDSSLLARVMIDGMARSLKDNHVAYLEPKLWQRAYAESVGENTLISPGFDLALDDASGKFYLYEVYANTSAAQGGLKAGDIIEQVNGQPASKGSGNQGLYDLLTGAVGVSARLQVSRPATGQRLTAQVRVAEVVVPLIESRVLPGGVGYIKLRNFSKNAGEEFDKALAALQAQGITALIFDVRQNPGGSVAALTHIVSHFTHQNPLAISIDGEGKRTEEELDQNVPLLGLPFIVLVNGSSASSSDITAAIAKDRGGHLVGVKSAGALGAAIYYELEDGSALEITVARVLGPNGEEINEIGVTPDHTITLTPADLSANNDPQLQHALAELTKP